MEIREAVIVDTARTAIGKRKGALANWHPTDLLGFALRTLIERNELDPGIIDDVVGGCVTQSGEQSTNVTRNAWVAAGLPPHVPATSVDRQCGSSQQAVHFVAQGVMAGAYDIAIACGVESMTRAPMASNSKGGTGPFSPSFMRECDGVLGIQFWVAEVLADRYGVTREDMDVYAVESHRRAQENTDNGFFAKEIIPVPIKDEAGELTGAVLEHDEGIRPGTTMEILAGLAPAMSWDPDQAPNITAGNSSQMNDAASAMIVASRETAERLGLPVRARFKHFAVAAEDPVLVLSAPVPVTHKLLDRTGMKISDFDAIECNEAFAAIALMWAREFDPDMTRFNPRGGAIAIGHPLGASGVRLMTTMLNHLEHTGGRYGFQTMCEGGGQANARPSSNDSVDEMGGFVSRWVVAQEHEIAAGDVDAAGFVTDEAFERWILSACAAYLDQCAVLREVAAGPGLELHTRPASSLAGVGTRLGRSTNVVVSAGVNEFRPESFTISLRVRSSGGDDDGVVNAACEVTVEDQAGEPCELGDAVRDELIALEHSASHIN